MKWMVCKAFDVSKLNDTLLGHDMKVMNEIYFSVYLVFFMRQLQFLQGSKLPFSHLPARLSPPL